MEDDGMEFLLDAIDRFPLGEEFADKLGHPDPVHFVFLSGNGASPAVLAHSNAGSGCAEKVGDGDVGRAREGVRSRRDASPTRSSQTRSRLIHQSRSTWLTKRCGTTSSSLLDCIA
ncbi:hypothetical protein ACQJBY_047764 [Aegilops geniculata]